MPRLTSLEEDVEEMMKQTSESEVQSSLPHVIEDSAPQPISIVCCTSSGSGGACGGAA